MMSEVMSKNGSIVTDLNLQNSKTNASSHIAAYGIYDLDTYMDSTSRLADATKTHRGKLVLINYSNHTSVTFQIPAGMAKSVGYRSLLAPKVTEKKNIKWAGQTIGEEGKLEGKQITHYVDCDGSDGCTVKVPGPGLVLALLDPNTTTTFYQEG